MTTSGLPLDYSLNKTLVESFLNEWNLLEAPDFQPHLTAVLTIVESFEEIVDESSNAVCVLAMLIEALGDIERALSHREDAQICVRSMRLLAFAFALHKLESDVNASKLSIKVSTNLENALTNKSAPLSAALHAVRFFNARLLAACTWPRDKYEALKARRAQVDSSRALKNRVWLADSLLSLGELLTKWGYEALFEESLPVFEELAAVASDDGDMDLLQLALERLAANTAKAGQNENALSKIDQLIAFYRINLSDKDASQGLIRAQLRQKGQICSDLKRWEAAITFINDGTQNVLLTEKEAAELNSRLVEALFNLDGTVDSGLLNDAETSARSASDNVALIRVLGVLTKLRYANFDYESVEIGTQIAALCLERHSRAETEHDNQAMADSCAILSCLILLKQENPDESRLQASRAITLFNRLHDPMGVANVHYERALCFLHLARRNEVERVQLCVEAIAAAEAALRIVRNAELRMQSLCYLRLADAFMLLEDWKHAADFLKRRRKMCLRANDVDGASQMDRQIESLPEISETPEDNDEDL
jgi:hypothetical protein